MTTMKVDWSSKTGELENTEGASGWARTVEEVGVSGSVPGSWWEQWSTMDYLWGWFGLATVLLLALDIYQIRKGIRGGKEDKGATLRGSVYWSMLWVGFSMLFLVGAMGLVYWRQGMDGSGVPGGSMGGLGSLWITGYIVEKSLSVDNLFVFLMLFASLGISKSMQNILLLYGIIGALVMRLGMIFFAALLVSKYSWVLIVFGFFLVVMGVKMWPKKEQEQEEEVTPGVVKKMQSWLPIDNKASGFIVKKDGKWWLTTSSLALVSIGLVDLIFAVDSIPAIFAITTDTWIVASSNVFAVLGLRPLYFVLSHLKNQLEYLPYALSIILVFIGGKLLVSGWWHMPVWLSLSVILGVLSWAALMSYRKIKESGRVNG